MERPRKESTGALSTVQYITNDGTLHTRNLLLRGMAGIYLCAFLTFYHQTPGLFGRNGILPAQNLYSGTKWDIPIFEYPTFIQYHSHLGLDIHTMLELVSLLGAVISFLVFISTTLCLMPIFATLWALYYSLVKHTHVFEHQSDDLLLEVGFACLILAPLSSTKKSRPTDKIAFVLLKWILMRFLFDSGAVKFFSGCPLWWNFQGLKHHFQTLPLPTTLARWSHYMPTDYLTVTNILTNLTELVCPWFFFLPIRAVRIFIFHLVFYLQLSIILTGNYGFLNFIVCVLLLALLDDKYLTKRSINRFLLEVILYCIAFTVALYIASGFLRDHKVLFRNEHLRAIRSMAKLAPIVPVVAVISVFLKNIISHPSITLAKGFWRKTPQLMTLIAFTFCTLSLIGVSIVPHRNIDSSLNLTNTELGRFYKDINKFHIINEYGRHLRRMRMERIEINLEYSDDMEGPWITMPFVYKPWAQNESMPYAGPYLPRLDMKFYDAAHSSYRDHLWIMPLAYRILQNQPDVLKLFGMKKSFSSPPRYVRGTLYRFSYTPLNKQSREVWKRFHVGEHFAAVSLTDTVLISHLRNLRYPTAIETPKIRNRKLKDYLDFIRSKFELYEAHKYISMIFTAGIVINVIRG